MPSLTPVSDRTETLSSVADASQTLAAVSDGTQTLSEVDESTNATTTTLGFFPGLTLYQSLRAVHPFPGSSAYPGDTYTTPQTGLALTPRSDGTETLTAVTEI